MDAAPPVLVVASKPGPNNDEMLAGHEKFVRLSMRQSRIETRLNAKHSAEPTTAPPERRSLIARASMVGHKILPGGGGDIPSSEMTPAERQYAMRDRFDIHNHTEDEEGESTSVASSFMLNPQTMTRLSWDVFITLILLYVALSLPVLIGFDLKVKGTLMTIEVGWLVS